MGLLLWSKKSVVSRSNRIKSGPEIPKPDRFVTKKPAMKIYSLKVRTTDKGRHVSGMDTRVLSKDADVCLPDQSEYYTSLVQPKRPLLMRYG
jgi:hypothetical protein